MKNNKSGFTLIELIVSLSILSIIMVSIFTIFQISAELSNKTDISRSMQENIKNIVETIAEDVRKKGIYGVNNDIINSNCTLPTTSLYSSGSKLCLGNGPTPDVSYYLAIKDKLTDKWMRVTDYSKCDIKTQCFIVRHDLLAPDINSSITQLSNSWVDFNNLYFYISDYGRKKVTLNFEMQPSSVKGIKPNLIKDNKIIFQTTISERLYKDY